MKHRLPVIIALLAAISLCSCRKNDEAADNARLLDRARLAAILRPGDLRPNPYDAASDSMPYQSRKLRIRHIGGSLGSVFRDSNYLQLISSRAIGIRPIDSNSDIWQRRPLVRVRSNENIYIAPLQFSVPYLVPKAADLLNDIGQAFRDSLKARGGGDYRLKVTSVLRTVHSVSKLRRHNVNAVEPSTHLNGTSFDISYSRFICDAMPADSLSRPLVDPGADPVFRTAEDLKNLLGEILDDFRRQGRCYVKFERHQACFHITVR